MRMCQSNTLWAMSLFFLVWPAVPEIQRNPLLNSSQQPRLRKWMRVKTSRGLKRYRNVRSSETIGHLRNRLSARPRRIQQGRACASVSVIAAASAARSFCFFAR